MIATAEHDDPAEWSEARLFNESLLIMVIERPELAAIVGVVEFDETVDDTAFILCFDDDTERLFDVGTPINRRLTQLLERPVIVTQRA